MSQDWTTGAAKWAAVFVLGTLSGAGVVWSFISPSAPAVIVRAPASPPPIAPPPTPISSAPMSRPAGVLPAPEPAPHQHAASMVPLEPERLPEAAPASTPVPAPAPLPAAPLTRTININTASAAELELLPGVGPVLAGRIVEYRSRVGGFRTIEQLDDVKGIGPKSLEKLRPHIRVQ